AGQAELPRTHRPAPTVPAITPGDLMTRLYILADDSMQGREAGTAGNVKGTDYIAAEIKRSGLVPAGDDGTYFQTIPLKTRTFDTTSTFTVAGAPLTAFRDYVPLGPRSLESPSLAIVFGGEVGDSATRIGAEQASGRLVVLRVRGGAVGLRALRSAPSLPGAAAVALVALDSLAPQALTFLRRPRTGLGDNPAGPAAPTPAFLFSARKAPTTAASWPPRSSRRASIPCSPGSDRAIRLGAAPTRSPTAPTTTAPAPSRRSRSPSGLRPSSANRSGRSCSCGTPAKR